MDAGRPGRQDTRLPLCAVSGETIQDHDGIEMIGKYDSDMETQPILSVLANYERCSEQLDAQRLVFFFACIVAL